MRTVECQVHAITVRPSARAVYGRRSYSRLGHRDHSYLLLYGDNGVVVCASYTDVRVGLPALWLINARVLNLSAVRKKWPSET